MLTLSVVILGFALLLITNLVLFKATVSALSGTTTPAIAAGKGFTCPYCRIDVVSPRDLDIINHVLCIDRAKEDYERLRAEAKTAQVVDDYFIDARSYTANSRMNFSAARQSHAYMNNDLKYQVDEAIIYRNGEAIKTVHGKGTKTVTQFAEREVTIDKQKRRAKR